MDIKLVNRALLKIGENPLSSENEKPWGPIAEILYDTVRSSMLAMYPWRFAVKEAELAPLEEKPVSNHAFKFMLPSDCLLFLTIGDIYKMADLRDLKLTSGERFAIIGNTIEANFNPLKVWYIGDIKDVSLYSQWFKEALVSKLASELTVKIHQNLNLKQLMEQEFTTAISMAIQANEIIQDTQEIGDNSWVSVREGWGWH